MRRLLPLPGLGGHGVVPARFVFIDPRDTIQTREFLRGSLIINRSPKAHSSLLRELPPPGAGPLDDVPTRGHDHALAFAVEAAVGLHRGPIGAHVRGLYP